MENNFTHKLPVDDIVTRQTEETDTNWLETVSGQMYPLIKIKEQLLKFVDIISFRIKTGFGVFLPQLTLTFDDSEKVFTESNYIENGDVITIYVGNPNDKEHRPIKNNYYVTKVNNSKGSSSVSISAQLHIPKLFNSENRVWSNKTSLQVVKEIAKDCDIGFTTNLSGTDDAMDWIQYEPNHKFIKEVTEKSFSSADTFLVSYIDQWANLNYLDVNRMINEKSDVDITTMPITGEKLKNPHPLYLSNSYKDGGEDTTFDDKKPIPKISEYSPYNDYGISSGGFVENVFCNSFDLVEDSESEYQQKSMGVQLKEKSTFTNFDYGNTHDKYNFSKSTNRNNIQIIKGLNIKTSLNYYIPILYNGMNIPIKIYNTAKTEKKLSQDKNVGINDIQDVEPTNKESYNYSLNDFYSGDVLIVSMEISYNKGVYIDSTNRIQQHLKLLKL